MLMAAASHQSRAGCIIAVQDTAPEDWDPYVMRFPDASLYHLSGWPEIAREVFGHRTLYLAARDSDGALAGVLPVIRQRSWLLGSFATSLAFFSYGGALAADPSVAERMMERAAGEAEALGCRYLEFRDIRARSGPWAPRTDKVTLQLELPSEAESLAKSLGSKLRSQVRRAEREGAQSRSGSAELLADFYAVFAENMRDLGTPVYPKRFFEAIIMRFPEHCQLVVIDLRGEPVAAGLLTFWRGRAEVPWAACRAKAKPLGINMKLYWELLSLSVGRGCALFDFGRSTVDSGTYRFKRQWGAKPRELHWYRWQREEIGAGNGHEDDRDRMLRFASAVWQRLPLPVANTLGPLISGALPW
jgi:serine/alanine adding enzyme